MPTPKKGARLGGSPAHQRLMLSNLATSLFQNGRITTTEAKARQLRPLAEKLITKAKRGDLHNRRLVLRTIRDKGVVHLLFTEIAPKFAERPGGYTRITKIGPRKGDNAPMAVIELVNEPYVAKPAQDKKAAKAEENTPAAATPEPEETEAAAAAEETAAEEAGVVEADPEAPAHDGDVDPEAAADEAPEADPEAPADSAEAADESADGDSEKA